MKKRQLFASGRCLPHIYNFNLIVVLQDVFKLTVNHSVCMGNFHIFTRETKLVLDHYNCGVKTYLVRSQYLRRAFLDVHFATNL